MPRRNLWLLAVLIAVSGICSARAHRYARVFAFAMEQVHARALRPVTKRQLFEGALGGMIKQLGDEHSVYMSREAYAEIEQSLKQQFGGIGVEVVLDPDTQQLTVATPLPGTPAELSGIRPRDKILEVDGKSTKGLSLSDAARLLKGEPGTPVAVLVQHEGEQSPVQIRIIRAVIQEESVLGDSRKPDRTWDFFLRGYKGIGYVRISLFGQKTATELEKTLRGLLAQGMEGLVLDLRDNQGGLLDPAVEVCRLFVRSGVIVTTRDRHGAIRDRFEATGRVVPGDFPVAVLVNNFSASASEIVAACLQDHGRAVIVGQRSFGKGTVQEILRLPADYGAIKLTAASYWRPSGKNINRQNDQPGGDWGVRPNQGYEVPMDKQQLAALIRWWRQYGLLHASAGNGPGAGKSQAPLRTEVDPQLAKAVEYLQQELTRRRQGPP
ncbi:MAG: S41 family peptidase [Thermoguttaceae bacterium]